MVDRDGVLNEFLRRYLSDAEAGQVRSRAEYLAMFSESSGLVAAEFDRLQEDREVEVGPHTIGPYRVESALGRGGQGTVYLAEDSRLGRKVAVKLLTGWSAGSREHRVRFLREAKVASQVEHPGICTVYDAGVHEGHPYIAMRFVAGETLAQRIAGTSAAPSTRDAIVNAATTIERAARALHAAHESGIVHRDVKPGNIQIADGDHPVILDFGLAHAAEDETLTRSGDVFGTPAYMSPEQVRGEHADPRTDVWALGVVLHELLTLRRPFDAPTREALYRDILKREPESPRVENTAIPRDLEVIVETALAKELSRRYQSAEHLSDDLARFCRGEPVHARPISITGRALRWARREPARAVAAFTVVVAALAIATLGGYLLSLGEVIDVGEARIREQEFEGFLGTGYEQVGEWNATLALQAFEEALRLRPDSVEALAGEALAHVRRSDYPEAVATLDRIPETAADRQALGWVRVHVLRESGREAEAAELEGSLPEPHGTMQLFLAGIVALQRGEKTHAEKDFARALDLLDRAQRHAERARLLFHTQIAHAASHVGDEREALRSAEALEWLWPDSPRAWFHVGLAVDEIEPDRAEQAYRKAIALWPEYAVAHLNLGYLLEKKGNLDGAESEYERARTLASWLARAPYNLGNVAEARGDRERAKRMYEEALAVDPDFAQAHNNLGRLVFGEGRVEDAARHFRAAVTALPDYPEAWNNLGGALANSGRFEEAVEALEKAVEFRPDYLSAHVNLGAVYMYLEDLGQAGEHMEQALSLRPGSAAAWSNLGSVRLRQGEVARARVAFEKALELQPGLVAARVNLGLVHVELGAFDEARRCFREVLAGDPWHVAATRALADLLFMEGDAEGAAKLVEAALFDAPNLGETDRRDLEEDLDRFRG